MGADRSREGASFRPVPGFFFNNGAPAAPGLRIVVNGIKESVVKCVFPRRIDSELVSRLPLAAYSGPLKVVETEADADEALRQISRESVLGFDTESRPSFRRGQNYPVSILQLGGEKCVWVFRLDALRGCLAKIYAPLANPKIRKVGVAVKGDVSGLRKLRDFEPAGFEDISDKTRKIGIVNTGLRNLAAVFMGMRISKSAQMSNWAAEKLTEKQITYAATDAWISRELYLAVNRIYSRGLYDIEPEPEPVLPDRRGALAKFWDALRSRFFTD